MSAREHSAVRFGIKGAINGYDVVAMGDTILVERDGAEVARGAVAGLGRFVANAGALRLDWGQFPDGDEVIFLYDKGDQGFGYALNLDWPDGSEWGYAPFGGEDSHDH